MLAGKGLERKQEARRLCLGLGDVAGAGGVGFTHLGR